MNQPRDHCLFVCVGVGLDIMGGAGAFITCVAAIAAGVTGTRRLSEVKPARGAVSTEAGDRSGTRAAAALFLFIWRRPAGAGGERWWL